MNIITQKMTLVKAIDRVMAVIDKKIALPALACVALEPVAIGLRMTAANLTAQMTIIAPGQVIESGQGVLVELKAFKAAVNGLKKGPVTLLQDEDDAGLNILRLTQGDVDAPLTVKPMSAFPFILPVVAGEGVKTFGVSALTLGEMVRHTAFAAAKEDHRPVLMGSFFQVTSNTLVMVSADGYRLALHEAPLTQSPESDVTFIIQAADARHLMATVASYDLGDVTVLHNPNADLVTFQHEHWTVTARTMWATYPQFRTTIPETTPMTATVNRVAWLAALDEINTQSKQNNDCVTSTFLCEEGATLAMILSTGRMTAIGPSDAYAQALPVPLADLPSGPLSFSVDRTFLREALTAYTSESVMVRVGPVTNSSGSFNVPMISPSDAETTFCLIMPMNP